MSSAQQYFSQAELALAAYANLNVGRPDELKLRDGDKGLSAQQAAKFAETYNVITQYNDTAGEGGMGTGLSATVFVDKTTHQLTLAIRGTEIADSRDLTTDAVMITAGVAYDQVVALYNWWSRETAALGTQVMQYRLTATPLAPQAIQLGSLWLEPAGTVNATGGLISITKGVSFAFFLEQPCHVAHALN